MIKINLATRKQSVLVTESGGQRAAKLFATGKFTLPKAEDLPIRKIVIAAVSFGALWFTWNSYQKDEIDKFQQELTKLETEQTRLTTELGKTRNDEAKRKEVEADAATLKAKLDTINKLVTDRQAPPKILLALATDIPKNVWLTDVKLADTSISLKGNAVALDDISGFIKSLNESTYFSEFKLLNSQQALDDQQVEIASFELTGARK
jgi:hypothetical protein